MIAIPDAPPYENLYPNGLEAYWKEKSGDLEFRKAFSAEYKRVMKELFGDKYLDMNQGFEYK